jgi:hypothetical protein
VGIIRTNYRKQPPVKQFSGLLTTGLSARAKKLKMSQFQSNG